MNDKIIVGHGDTYTETVVDDSYRSGAVRGLVSTPEGAPNRVIRIGAGSSM